MNWVWVERPGIVGQFSLAGDPAIPASDRGFTYGDGLFETVRVSRGAPLFLRRHLARLLAGLAQIGFPPIPWDGAALAERCLRTIAQNEVAEGVLRLAVTRGSGPRGFEPPEQVEPLLVIQALTPNPSPVRSERERGGPAGAGVRAILAPWKIDPASPLCYVKHLSALDKVLARQGARAAGADEALFHNLDGCLTEGAASNLFLVLGGRILTPAVRCGLLAGIARGLLLEAGEALPVSIAEEELPVERLAEAGEAFLTNAVMGVRPLVAVDGRPIGDGRPGPMTALAAEYVRRLWGEEAGNRGWGSGVRG